GDRFARAVADQAELLRRLHLARARRRGGARRRRRADFPELGGRHLEAQRAALDPRALAVDREKLAANSAVADLHRVADTRRAESRVAGRRRRGFDQVLGDRGLALVDDVLESPALLGRILQLAQQGASFLLGLAQEVAR